MTPIRRRPCADPGQKQVPGEWMTQKGIDSSRPVTEASCAHGVVSMHTSIHSEVAGITRHSRTQWFTAYSVLSPAIGLSCHRRLRKLPLRKLDAGVEASGPHVFAVR